MQNKTLDTARANNLGTTDPETTDLCPTDRELAALLDGALEATKAEEVRKHVLACADCHEVYVDAIRFELEEAPGEVLRPNVVPFERAASAATAEDGPVAPPVLHLAPTPAEPVPLAASVIQASAQVPAPPPAPGAVLAPSRREKRRRERFPWLRAAAGLVLAAFSAFMFWPKAPKPAPGDARPALSVQSSGASLAVAPNSPAKLEEIGKVWKTFRGADHQISTDPGAGLATKYRIGRLRLDLQVAAVQQNPELFKAFAEHLSSQSKSLLSLESQSRSLGDLAVGLSDVSWEPGKAAEVLTVADSLLDADGLGRAYEDYGHWCEAGKLAAASRHPDLFNAKEMRPFLSWLLRPNSQDQDSIRISSPARGLLEEIERNWPTTNPTAANYDALEKSFAGLVSEYSSQTGP